jgi:SEC-C motif-containing protein
MINHCPCGPGRVYLECCGKYLEGNLFAETPEALMRSRYTAFVNNRLDYIERTMAGPALLRYQEQGTKSASVQWCGLEVLQALYDSLNPTIGTVEFIARYRANGVDGFMREKSQFQFENQQWFYVDGDWMSEG